MADNRYDVIARVLDPGELDVFTRPPKKVANSHKERIFSRLEGLDTPVFSERNAVEFRKRLQTPEADNVSKKKIRTASPPGTSRSTLPIDLSS
jgi:hypothetical protein